MSQKSGPLELTLKTGKGFAYNKSTPDKSQTITDKTHLVTTTQSSATMIRTNSLNNSTSSKLLRWCQFVTQEYPNVDITNLNESFRNGLAMCAILHHFHPDLFDYASLNEGNPSFNHKLHTEQFELVGGTSYVEPDDFSLKRLEEKSLFTHLRTMYETLNDRAPHVGYFDKKTYAPFGSETTTVVAEDDVGDMSDVENEDVDNKRDDNNGGGNNDHTVTQQQIQQQQQNVVEEDEKTRRRREHLERFERERLAREQEAEQLLATATTITSTEATEPTVATDSIMTDDDENENATTATTTTTTSISYDDKMDTSIAIVTENHDDNEILRMKNAEIEAQEQKLLLLRQEHEQQLQGLQFQFQQFQEQSAQRQQELEQNQRAQQELLQKELEIQRQDQEKLRVELQEQVRSLVEHHQFELQEKQDKLQLSLQQQKEEHGSELQKLQQQLHQQKEREQELVRQLQQKEQQWKEQTEKLSDAAQTDAVYQRACERVSQC